MEVGSFCWSVSTADRYGNQLCFIVASEGGESLALCCDTDTRLAGHLDVVMESGETGLPFTVTVLTHVARWISDEHLRSAFGCVSALAFMEIENARAGIEPESLVVGRRLRSPVLEPRWPMIERRARRFLEQHNQEVALW